MSQSDWQTVLNQLLAKIERKTKSTLHEINDIFHHSENKIDDKFRKNFLDILNNRVSETYERFEIDASSINRKKLDNEATSTVDIKPIIDSSDAYRLLKKKHKFEPDSNSNEMLKKPKMENVQSSDAGSSSHSELETLMYTCMHCQDKKNSNRRYSSIERLYEHWTSAHSVVNNSEKVLPFQFYVSEIVKCYYCSKIGNYAELRDHHENEHSIEGPLGMVLLNDTNVCALCNSNDIDLINHFKSVHSIISKAHVYNPICMTDQVVNQLLATKIHKKFMCARCPKVCQTQDEMAMHHSKAHNGSQMKVSKYSSDNSIQIICWFCGNVLAADHFMQHIRSHSNVMKCTECKFISADINEHVKHAASVHNKIKTVDDICLAFSDLLKRKYFEMKILFGNGLVLVKHNLLGTRMNDSREFGCYIKELLEKKKGHQPKTVPIIIDDDAQHEKTSPIDELDKQTRLLDSVQITNFPNDSKTNALKLFLQYTELLECPLNADDVDKIYRLDRSHLIVKFKTNEVKEQILQIAAETMIDSGYLVNLPLGEESKPIKVENFLTPWYEKMNQIALDAKQAKKILCFWINEGGMAVKRTKNAPAKFVWSAEQLITFINHDA